MSARCWTTSDGGVLIERAQAAPSPPAYYLLDGAAGAKLRRSFEPSTSAVQEVFSWTEYGVEGDALVCTRRSKDDAGDPPDVTRATELSGLVPAGGEARWVAALEAALEAERARQASAAGAADRQAADRLASFEAALPAGDGGGPLRFVFGYAFPPGCGPRGGTIEVRLHGGGLDGAVVWRDPSHYAFHGKYLFQELRAILARRYGPRLGSFQPDVADPRAAELFDPE